MAGGAIKRLTRGGFRALGYEVRRVGSTPAVGQALPPAQQSDEVARFVARRLIALEVDVVLDVGAHVGGFAIALRTAGWAGRIVSFEPVSASYQALVAAAASDPSWEVHRLALGRERTEREIGVTGATNFASFHPASAMARERWGDRVVVAEREVVEVRRLDEVLADVVAPLSAPRVFLKMDTQGSDLDVFAGASGCLDRIVGLVSEVSIRAVYDGVPHYLDAIRAYEDAGYALAAFIPVNRDAQWRLLEADCVMIRPSDPSPGVVPDEAREAVPDAAG